MEKSQHQFVVAPPAIQTDPALSCFTFSITNTSLRSTHYQIFVPDPSHFQLIGNRTFSLAPGITKNSKIKHLPCSLCSSEKQAIEVIDGLGNVRELQVTCLQEEEERAQKLQLPKELCLQQLAVNEERRAEVLLKNVSEFNMKIKVRKLEIDESRVQVKLEQDSFIILSKSSKPIVLSIKMLAEAQIQLAFEVESIEEQSREVKTHQLKVVCNSLLRSQYIADLQMKQSQTSQHIILNGTSLKSSFNLVNNYHESCPYKILEIIEFQDYQSYAQKLTDTNFKLETKTGKIEPKSTLQIGYEICTFINENDRSFISRYSQLLAKDESSAFKLRSSKHFKKAVQIHLAIQFGVDHILHFRIKNQIVNPALRVIRSAFTHSDEFTILNDTGLDVPFKILSNLYYVSNPERGILTPGSNHVDVSWKNQSLSNFKDNVMNVCKCAIKMEIPQMQIVLCQPTGSLRPKTALLKDKSRVMLSKSSLLQKISSRAPVKKGNTGVKSFREVSAKDFQEKENKYIKHQLLEEDQFGFLQTSQNDKGFVVTNAHPFKNILVQVPGKGNLFMESCSSYVLPFDKTPLKLEHNGKQILIKSKQLNDKQPFRINNKELLFCFSHAQKEFEVVKEVEVTNRSNDFLMMYCLSLDDEYFHSLEPEHKVLINPGSTRTYRISFRPESEQIVKNGKITRFLQFLISGRKEVITCEGDLLPAAVTADLKDLTFDNCAYSCSEVIKKFNLINRNLNKASFSVSHSENIKISPSFGNIPEKGQLTLTLSFRPSELTKIYQEKITVEVKGSHLIRLPFIVHTLEPDIYCQQETLNFGEGYMNQVMTSKLALVNNNKYPCSLNFNWKETELQGPKTVSVEANTIKEVQIKLQLRELGQKIVKLTQNFIELSGYGAIKGPMEYRVVGKKTILQLIPDNPFNNLICSKHQEAQSFALKNISQSIVSIKTVLTKKSSSLDCLILSCEPNEADLAPGEAREFRLHSIRTDEEDGQAQLKQLMFSLQIYLKQGQLYRSIDFVVALPPPEIEIIQKEVYFPLTCVGAWSRTSFTVVNKGYKEVFLTVRRPTNVAFEFQVELENNDNRLTKLRNSIEVRLFFKSKKPVSFGVFVEVENNFGQKQQVKVNGTASRSPLLKCDRVTGSANGLSNREIRLPSSSTHSLKSISLIDNPSEEHENLIFFNKWINGIFPDSSRHGQHYNEWLKSPDNFISLLNYIQKAVVFHNDPPRNHSDILDELKRMGYPVYTLQQKLLREGNSTEWAMCLWFILSKEIAEEDCLKWINKVCNIKLQTYDSAFNHHKKILMDLIAKLLDPVFKSKVGEWQKVADIFQASIPIIAKVDNKRQFIFLINLLYNKLSSLQLTQVSASNFVYRLVLPGAELPTPYWILSDSSFEVELPENCTHQKYLPQKKLLSFLQEGPASVCIRIKEDSCLAVWTNSFQEPLRIYQVALNKKAPFHHSITIECEDQCSQQWRLKFPCEIQSQYFFEFSGGKEFKCIAPQLGVIKAGDTLEFIIVYSPTNLKDHQGVLTISNKFQQHFYNLKGKPLRTSLLELEKVISVNQGQKLIESFSISQDQTLVGNSGQYFVKEVGCKTEELRQCEAKSNKKEIIITAVLQFERVVRNYQIKLQLCNKEQTFCRNIRLTINVVARPVLIQGELRGVIEKITYEKIPIVNAFNTKQNCFISIRKLSKEQYQESTLENQLREDTVDHEDRDEEFALSPVGKIVLKPKENIRLQLAYHPVSLTEAYCQVRIHYELSEQLCVYNFMGQPEVPSSDSQTMQITCQVDKESSRSIKVYNKFKERVKLDVQTNLPFIAGPEQLVLQGRQTCLYKFKLQPLHPGNYSGKIVFRNDKCCMVYPLQVGVKGKKQVQVIHVRSRTRVTTTISIQLANKSDRKIEYQVLCERQHLEFPDKIEILPQSQQQLFLRYTPLFVGLKSIPLRLYSEMSNQIVYQLEMKAEEHREECKFACPLGQHKSIQINLKNPTKFEAHLVQPILPSCLSCKISNQTFPLLLSPNSTTHLELLYIPEELLEEWRYSLNLSTDLIGDYHFDLVMESEKQSIMEAAVIKYDFEMEGQTIEKACSLLLVNPFNKFFTLRVQKSIIHYNNQISLRVEGETLKLHPYEKRYLRYTAHIKGSSQEQGSQSLAENSQIVVACDSFRWIYPITLTRLHSMNTVIEIAGPSHELISSRVTLKHLKSVKQWEVANFSDFKKQMNISVLTANDIYLQAIINKHLNYCGSITFFQEDMKKAEKYQLIMKIQGRKIKSIPIEANVGEVGEAKIKIKNGRGNFKVEFKNNRRKEFVVKPLEGIFSQTSDNFFTFQYIPVEYNGCKRAEVTIVSEGGNFDFCLLGKFPLLKPK